VRWRQERRDTVGIWQHQRATACGDRGCGSNDDGGDAAPRAMIGFMWRYVFSVASVVALLVGGCDEQETVEESPASCPNEVPRDGDPCPTAGLVCHYYTGCVDYYPATCQSDGTWQFDDLCTLVEPSGGGTATGGAGGTATGGAGGAATGGAGGAATGGAGGAATGGAGGAATGGAGGAATGGAGGAATGGGGTGGN